jgi:hypothetical protein
MASASVREATKRRRERIDAIRRANSFVVGEYVVVASAAYQSPVVGVFGVVTSIVGQYVFVESLSKKFSGKDADSYAVMSERRVMCNLMETALRKISKEELVGKILESGV